MRRLLVLFLVAACLLPEAGPVRAQATSEQMDRLSLEALTTPAPGGNPGSYRRSARRSSYRGLGRRRSSYGRSSYGRHSYARRSYASRGYASRGYASGGYGSRGYASRGSARGYGRSYGTHRRSTHASYGRARYRGRHHATAHHHRRRRR